MHLAIVSPYPPGVTGIGQYGYHISNGLARCGVFDRITLLTAARTSAREQGVNFVSPGIEIERLWEMDQVDTGWKLLARLRQLQPDLIWYNLGASIFGRSALANLSGLSTPWLTRRFSVPSVITLHEMVAQADLQALNAPGGRLAPLGAGLITRLCTQADVVCVTLKRSARWLANRLPEVRWVHIPHGSFERPQFLLPSGELEILIFTTYAPFKGLELLIEAFLALRETYPSLALTIAGAEHPRYPGYLRKVREVYGELVNVKWLGTVAEEDLRLVFGQAAVVVLPYTATTGSSSVLIKATSLGRPVVCSDLPELAAVAAEAGLRVEFFRNRDKASLVQALDRLLNDPERRMAQAQHNYTVVSRLTLEEICQAYLRAFNQALASHTVETRLALPVRTTEEIW
jgi:glycosyltransferase involved in cell wall biosynthesis